LNKNKGLIMKKLINKLNDNLKRIGIILVIIGFIITMIFSSFGIGSSLIEIIFGYIGAIILIIGILLVVKTLIEK